MEVHTPLLASSTTSDPHIHSLSLHYSKTIKYLQTSPEQHMKRLLCANMGDIYQLSPVFRCDESGKHHNPEFYMLEWYRIGYSIEQLINEASLLLKTCTNQQTFGIHQITYAELWKKYFNINPHIAKKQELLEISENINNPEEISTIDLRDIIFATNIQPRLVNPTVVRDFPLDTAAMAKTKKVEISGKQIIVADRFEVYWKGLEVINGYAEETDSNAMKERYIKDNEFRKETATESVPPLNYLYDALDNGMPQCSGAALGLERLHMCLRDKRNIAEVISFPIDIA